MNATEHNELSALIEAISPLAAALQEPSLEHIMVLPSGRWTAQEDGKARRRTTVLDAGALAALVSWLAAHPGARHEGQWLLDVIDGVEGSLLTAERCPSPAEDFATQPVHDALKQHLTRGENGVILGPVRARKLELLCWIAQQYIQEQIILISDRAPTEQLGPRVVHVYPPRDKESLNRLRRLLRRCDAVLWDEVSSKEDLHVALGHPGARRRWVTMDAANTRAGFEALARRLQDMAPGDVSAIAIMEEGSGQLTHFLRRVSGRWQETTRSETSLLPILESHFNTPRFAISTDHRTTIEAQEYRFDSPQDASHKAREEEPADIPSVSSLEGLPEFLSEAEELEEASPPHMMATSSIDELLEDSEGSDALDSGEFYLDDLDPVEQSATPAPTDEDTKQEEEAPETFARFEARGEGEEVSTRVDVQAIPDKSEDDEVEGEDEVDEMSAPEEPDDTPEDRALLGAEGEEEHDARGEEQEEPAPEGGEEVPFSERATEQISPEEVQLAVEARDRELLFQEEDDASEEDAPAQHQEKKETIPGDSLAALQEALAEVEAEIHSGGPEEGAHTNPNVAALDAEPPAYLLPEDPDAKGAIPDAFEEDHPATQEFFVEGDTHADIDIIDHDILSSLDTPQPESEASFALEEISVPEQLARQAENIPEDTQVEHNFSEQVGALAEDERRAHLNDLLKIEEELRVGFTSDEEPTGLHVDPLHHFEEQETGEHHRERGHADTVAQHETSVANDMLAALDDIYAEEQSNQSAPLELPTPDGILTPPAAQDEPTQLTAIPDAIDEVAILIEDDDLPPLSWGDDEETVQRERRQYAQSLMAKKKISPPAKEPPPSADASSSTSVKLNALSQRLRALRQKRQQNSGQFDAVSRDEEEGEQKPTNLLDALKRDD